MVQGHAIEVRLYAEDPAHGFLPSVGRIEDFTAPTAAVVDSSYASGDEVSRFYDPLIAKITTSGADRAAATTAMLAALHETTITGVTTNKDMLVAVLESFPFFAADTTTAFLEEHPSLVKGARGADRPIPALLIAAVFHYLDTQPDPGPWTSRVFAGNLTSDPVPPRFRNVPGTPGFVGLQWGPISDPRIVWVLFESRRDHRWQVWLVDPTSSAATQTAVGSDAVLDPYRAEREDLGAVRVTRPAAVEESLTEDYLLIEMDGLITRVTTDQDAGGVAVRTADAAQRFQIVGPRSQRDTGVVAGGPVAPVPGTVAAVEVAPGDAVSEGQTLVVLEAMKMEHRIQAESSGVVTAVLVQPGQSVEAHQVVVELGEAGEVSDRAGGSDD
jgi:acetyl/propionyl-CoA carboxylase alpha subunit